MILSLEYHECIIYISYHVYSWSRFLYCRSSDWWIFEYQLILPWKLFICWHHGPITYPDSKVHGANMGPTWVLLAPGGPYVGSMNFAIRAYHYNDVIMGMIASQITSLMIAYSIIYSDADHRKHQSSASLAFVWGIHRGPVNSPHKWPVIMVMRKMLPFDDVIM